MMALFDNLKPFEKRLVVIIGAVVFIAVNLFVVAPHFSDWSRTKNALKSAQDKYTLYLKLINNDTNHGGFKDQIDLLQKKGGTLAVEQSSENALQRTIMNQASAAGVQYNTIIPVPTVAAQTNEFFEEESLRMSIDRTGEKELVGFLYDLGGDSSMIRVREMDLKPFDANRYSLHGTVTFSANFQKQPPASAKTSAKPAFGTRGGLSPVATPPAPAATTPAGPARAGTNAAASASRRGAPNVTGTTNKPNAKK